MNIKNEIIIGVIGSLIIIGMVFLNINKFNTTKSKLLNNNKVNVNNSGSSFITGTVINTQLTIDEVKKHNTTTDCWIIINNSVYDVTSYSAIHPGGDKRITSYCGQDATEAFATQGGKGSHSSNANQDLLSLKLGEINQEVDLQETKSNIINNINKLNSQGKEREEEYEDD